MPAPSIPVVPNTGLTKGTIYVTSITDVRQGSRDHPLDVHFYGQKWEEKASATVFALLQEGFSRRGYKAGRNPPADTNKSDALVAEVVLNKVAESLKGDVASAIFLGGLSPKAMIVEMTCTVTLTKNDGKHVFVVSGRGVNSAVNYTPANITIVYTRAYSDFLKNLDSELEKLGL
jgi:hypothetical protein